MDALHRSFAQGVSGGKKHCETCNQDVMKCIGHYGYIDLQLPVFHIGFFRSIIVVLQTICKVSEKSVE